MRILITAAGMVGAYTAQRLVARGDEVAFIDIAPRPAYVAKVVGQELQIFRGDIRDLPSILAAINSFRPDVFVHTAALIGGVAQEDPYRGFQTNVVGTINVAEAVRLSGIGRLVHASTMGAHDLSQAQTAPLTEAFPVGRIGAGTIYSNSKAAAEQVVGAYHASYGFDLAVLRLGGVYGYGHNAGGSGVARTVSAMVDAASRGEPAFLGGGFPDPFELVHVKDVAQCFELAVHATSLPEQVFNVGSGVLSTTADVIAAVKAAFPGATVQRSSAPRAERFARAQPLDLTRSRDVLGYAPALDLVAGFCDVAEEMRRIGPVS